MHYVYIIYSKQLDKYYVGYTSNINQRVNQHNKGHLFSKFTKQSKNWELMHKEKYPEKTDAIKREKIIKTWKSRKKIEELIKNAG